MIDFNSDEYEMSYCFRPDTLFFEDYDVYSKCILKKELSLKDFNIQKGSKLKVIDFNSDEYEMSYCFRPDTLFLKIMMSIQNVYLKRAIVKKITLLIIAPNNIVS